MKFDESLGKHFAGDNFVEDQVSQYFDKYPEHMTMYESNAISQQITGGRVSSHELLTLGESLAQYESYQRFCEASGSIASLGTLPRIAKDVITAVQAQSLAPLLTSVQTMQDMIDIAYYKRIIAETTDGSTAAGTALYDHADGKQRVYDPQYGSSRQTFRPGVATALFQTVAATLQYNIALGGPVLPETFKLAMLDATGADMGIFIDDGRGRILGDKGISGTIDYTSGALVVDFAVDPAAVWDCVGTYDKDLERQSDLTTISSGLVGTPIHASLFALKAETGLIQDFAFAQRFGKVADDEAAQDLTSELITVINTNIILTQHYAKMGVAQFSKSAPAGVSSAEHKLAFADTLALAEQNLVSNSGSGVVNRLAGGAGACAQFKAMPGFTAAAGSAQLRVGLYGDLDGVPVIRASGVLPDDEATALYMGDGTYDAPTIHSTYIPLFNTDTLQIGNNPLRNQRAVATMIGIKNVVPQYITSIEFT